MDEQRYDIIRQFADPEIDTIVIRRGVTLEVAREHCRDPEHNSRTARHPQAVARTESVGAWFDGYREAYAD